MLFLFFVIFLSFLTIFICRFGFYKWYKPTKLILSVATDLLVPLITFPITHLHILTYEKDSASPPLHLSIDLFGGNVLTYKFSDASYASLCTRPLNSLPPSLTHLAFNEAVNSNDIDILTRLIQMENFPLSLTHLKLGTMFNHCVESLPPLLTYLTFGDRFNQSVDVLPHSLAYLEFGRDFNQKVDSLPPSLIHLVFGDKFNQAVDLLPCSLTHLTFGNVFDQKVDFLPHSLISLKFGFKFNQPVNSLPSMLKYLIFGASIDRWSLHILIYESILAFNQPIDNLPPSITHINLPKKYRQLTLPFAPSVIVTFTGV